MEMQTLRHHPSLLNQPGVGGPNVPSCLRTTELISACVPKKDLWNLTCVLCAHMASVCYSCVLRIQLDPKRKMLAESRGTHMQPPCAPPATREVHSSVSATVNRVYNASDREALTPRSPSSY